MNLQGLIVLMNACFSTVNVFQIIWLLIFTAFYATHHFSCKSRFAPE